MKLHRATNGFVAIAIVAAGLLVELPTCRAQEPMVDLSEYEPGFAASGRGTLLQWSDGTRFEGGPPGREEPLVSDRPDFTEASTTVGRGVAQVEMGYTFISNDDGGIRTKSHSFPEMLWRIGLFADWFEFRIAYNSGTTAELHNPLGNFSAIGSEDLYLGAKIGLTPQEGFLPEMALVPQMTVPTGSAARTSGLVLPGLNWLYGWDVTDRWSFGGSTQINKSIDENQDVHLEVAQSLTLGIGLTERLGMYTEWFVLAPSGASDIRTQQYLDGGLTFSVTNDLQLDVRAGIGLSHSSDDYFVGTGLVRRF